MELFGHIILWNDDTLTGMLEPIDDSTVLQVTESGTQEFKDPSKLLPISAAVFSYSNRLPQVDDLVCYQFEVGSDGSKRVVYAEYAGLRLVSTADSQPSTLPVQSGRAACLSLLILIAKILLALIALIIVLTLLAIPLGMLLAWLFPK